MRNHRLHTSAPATRFSRLNHALALAALLSAVAIAPQALANSVVGATPDDVALATIVQNALLNDKVFQDPSVDITVRAWQGKVNLSGWVINASDEPAARRIAGSVGGVKAITTNLRSWSSDNDDHVASAGKGRMAMAAAPSIIGATEADRTLAGNVRAAVMQDKAFQDADVNVVVRAMQGKVNLSGWVSFANNSAQARRIAATVPGVKSVTSNFKSWSTESDPRM